MGIKEKIITMDELQKLMDEMGETKMNMLFGQYFMMTVSKAMKCDRLAEALEKKDCTVEQLREILYDDGE